MLLIFYFRPLLTFVHGVFFMKHLNLEENPQIQSFYHVDCSADLFHALSLDFRFGFGFTTTTTPTVGGLAHSGDIRVSDDIGPFVLSL